MGPTVPGVPSVPGMGSLLSQLTWDPSNPKSPIRAGERKVRCTPGPHTTAPTPRAE